MSKKHLLNTLDHPLTLRSGYLVIKAGHTIPVTEKELEEDSISYAISRKWVEVTDKEVIPETKSHKVEVADKKQGLSEEELKSELAKKQEKKETYATTSELGKEEAPAEAAEAEEPETTPKRKRAEKTEKTE